jgi:hypothetical protein
MRGEKGQISINQSQSRLEELSALTSIMNKTFRFFGSDADLNAFEVQFKDAGFDKLPADPVLSSGLPDVPSIKYVISPAIGNCLKTILSTRRQRVVATGTGARISITGDFPLNEIERLLHCSRDFVIHDEVK